MFPAIARAAHGVNRAYRMALGEPGGPAWHAAPEETRNAVIRGVEYRHAHPDATPEDMHRAWASDKLAHGWTRGDVESALLKTHPNLVQWGSLSAEQRAKYAIFLAVIDEVMPLCIELQKSVDLLRQNEKLALEEQTGALLYITAMVKRFGGETGIVEMTESDMVEACDYELSRYDTESGGLMLKVTSTKQEEPEQDPAQLNLALPPNS